MTIAWPPDWSFPQAKEFVTLKSKPQLPLIVEDKLDGMQLLVVHASDGTKGAYTKRANRAGEWPNQWDRLPTALQDLVAAQPAGTALQCELTCGDLDRAALVGNWRSGRIHEDNRATLTIFGVPYFGGLKALDNTIGTLTYLDYWPGADQPAVHGSRLLMVRQQPLCVKEADYHAGVYRRLAENENLEGFMFKSRDLPYGKGWLKVKVVHTADCIIMGYLPGQGKFIGQIGSIAVGLLDKEENAHEVATVSGMDNDTRRLITVQQADLIGSVVEVEYNAVTTHRRLQHPRFLAFREDKPWRDCTLEQLES